MRSQPRAGTAASERLVGPSWARCGSSGLVKAVVSGVAPSVARLTPSESAPLDLSIAWLAPVELGVGATCASSTAS